jgi:predicted dehydrogenase
MSEDPKVSATAAIIGAGNIGRTHARAYRSVGVTVVAVCDVDLARAKALAEELQATAYQTVEDLLAGHTPTVISICTPPAEHVAAACRVLQQGIPVLCEKPLADTVAGARTIAAAARDAGTACMTGFCHRFHEPVLQLKAQLDAGAIGRPVFFRSRFAARFQGVADSWFADPRISGGGTLMDTSVHSLDLYRFLIGEITHVAAQLTTVTPGLRVEDNSVLLVNGPAGVPGTIEASWTSPAGESMLTIYGTDGTVSVDYGAGHFGMARIQRVGDPEPQLLPRGDGNRFAAEITHLLESLAAGRAPAPSDRDGLRALEVIAAAYEAARGSGCVEVPIE